MPRHDAGPRARSGFLAVLLALTGQELRAEDGNIAYAEIAVDGIADIDAVVQAAIEESPSEADAPKGDLLLLRLVDLSPEEALRLERWDRRSAQVTIAKDGGSRILSVPKSASDGEGSKFGALRTRLGLNSFEFSLDAWDLSTKQVVRYDSAKEALRLLQDQMAFPATPQQKACAEASNRLGALQRLVAGTNVDTAAIAAFDLACLGTIVPSDQLHEAPAFVRDSGAIRIVGVLERATVASDGTVTMEEFCSAFLVDGNTMVSARHCFYEVRLPTSRNSSGQAWDRGEVYFRRMVPPFASVQVGPRVAVNWLDDVDAWRQPQSQMPLSAGDDVIAFTLATSFPDVPEIRLDAKEGLTHAWVAGPTGIVREAAIIDADVPRSVRGLRWTRNAPCATAARGTTCALHVCQLTKGSSGAAIVGSSSNSTSVAIMGMHLGPYDQLGGACKAMIPDLQLNLNGAVRATSFLSRIISLRHLDDRRN